MYYKYETLHLYKTMLRILSNFVYWNIIEGGLFEYYVRKQKERLKIYKMISCLDFFKISFIGI